MTKKRITSDEAPKAIGPYSQAIELSPPPARLVYLAGQTPIDPATGELVPGDVAAQTERAITNLEAVLAAAGLTLANVVKTNVFLVDMADFARMNEVYGRRFPAPYPARSTVAVAGLPRGARVEIELIAAE